MKNTLANTKSFVKKHKTAILVTSAIIVTTVVVRKLDDEAYSSLFEFVSDKGLVDEYINSFEEI